VAEVTTPATVNIVRGVTLADAEARQVAWELKLIAASVLLWAWTVTTARWIHAHNNNKTLTISFHSGGSVV